MGYLNLAGAFVYRQPLFRAQLAALAGNDAQLKTDGWAAATKTVFYQAAVPTGWTKDTTNTDKALRVVGPIGGTGTGGSQAVSATITLNHLHTLATPSDGSHTHAFPAHTHAVGPSTTSRPSSNILIENSTYLYGASTSGFSTMVTQLKGPWPTPGALTLGTQAAHTHGSIPSALTDSHFAYCDVVIGTKDSPGGTYADLTSSFHTGDTINFDSFATFAANDAYNKANLMPAGSMMIWGQAAAPTGWTRSLAVTDRMLRVVSGLTGGSATAGVALSAGLTIGHTHVLPAVADHTHSLPNHLHTLANGSSFPNGVVVSPSQFAYISDYGTGFLHFPKQTLGLPTSPQTVYQYRTNTDGGGNLGLAGGHTHLLATSLSDVVLAYLDVIQCSKDASGEPSPYTDMTAVFAWKKLVTYQRLNRLGQNDAMIQYHTTPAGSQTFFYMASPPAGWVKITSQHDKCLRIVDGATGGTSGGGSHLLSQTISLAHPHVVAAQPDHSHLDSHQHTLGSSTQSVVAMDVVIVDNNGIAAAVPGGIQAGGHQMAVTTPGPDVQPSAAGTHSHGATTNSLLSDVALAYVDVIYAAKA